MSLTEQQARTALTELHNDLGWGDPQYLNWILNQFNYVPGTVEFRYQATASTLLAGMYEVKVGATETASPSVVLGRIPAETLVDWLQPGSPDRDGMINAIESGQITAAQFGAGAGLVTSSSSSFSELLAAVETATGLPVNEPALPESPLKFPGIAEDQLDFLVSMYIAAFSRAPEFEGLQYWAGDMVKIKQSGYNQDETFSFIGKSMYAAGERNGEGGTDLANEQYVTYAYNNALGRDPDAEGYAYWINELNTGIIERGNFLTTFLRGVEQGNRDDKFLDARVAVGSFAAQEHVSGGGAKHIDLRAIVNGVQDNATALSKINYIQDAFGVAQVSLSGISPEVDFWG